MNDRSARYASMALGLWLFVTAFLWRHSHPHLVNSAIMGAIVLVSSAIALGVPWFRMVTTAAGVWLIASLFAWTETAPLTVWHNFMVGVAVALLGLVPSRAESDRVQSTV